MVSRKQIKIESGAEGVHDTQTYKWINVLYRFQKCLGKFQNVSWWFLVITCVSIWILTHNVYLICFLMMNIKTSFYLSRDNGLVHHFFEISVPRCYMTDCTLQKQLHTETQQLVFTATFFRTLYKTTFRNYPITDRGDVMKFGFKLNNCAWI